MRIFVRQLLTVAAILVPAVASAQFSAPTTPAPGPSFVWVGQWVPCDHPLAVQAGLGCTTPTPTYQVLEPAPESDEPPPPPVQDEWAMTEAYTGVATRVPVLVR